MNAAKVLQANVDQYISQYELTVTYLENRRAAQPPLKRCPFREASIDKPVQYTSKDLVSHQDGEEQVAEKHSAREFDGIGEVARNRKHDADCVQRRNKREKFTTMGLSL